MSGGDNARVSVLSRCTAAASYVAVATDKKELVNPTSWDGLHENLRIAKAIEHVGQQFIRVLNGRLQKNRLLNCEYSKKSDHYWWQEGLVIMCTQISA